MAELDESGSSEAGTRAGHVALLGYPNVGKSSLLNCLIEQKLSIVTPLPQTTRERVIGIDTRDGVQMIFIDTPGLVDPRYLLHSSMLQSALNSIQEADVVLLLIDPLQQLPDTDREPFRQLAARPQKVIVVINKTDVAEATEVEIALRWAEEHGFSNVVRVSALQGIGIAELRQRIADLLPAFPYLYPPEEISAQPVRFFVAEFVRESIFDLYKDEVPYSVAVRIEEFREAASPIYIRAVIFVERASQKGILIGSGGAAIRRLGEISRQKIETFLDTRVYLALWVKVLPRWRKDAQSLRHLGYLVPPKHHA
jgi:GTPase